MKKIFDTNPALRQSLIELVSGDSGAFTRSGTLYYQDDNGVFRSVAADTPAFVNAGLVHVGSYRQECVDSEDVGEWAASGCTVAATGETSNGLPEYTITDGGANWHRAYAFRSSVSNSPSVRTFFVFYYNEGTSGELRIDFRDYNVNGSTYYLGEIGSAEVNLTNAGTLTILRDEYVAEMDWREVEGYIDWVNPANDITIGIGPNSTDNSNIKVYGADIFNDTKYRLPHVPSSGSTVSIATQAADGAGNGLAPALSDLDSRVEAALDSTFSTLFYLTPQFASTDIDATYHKLLSTGDFALSINNSNLAITDGTNTATVAHGGFDAGDELWLSGQADASTSKLRAGIIGDSSVTWGTETAYTGGMNPGTNLLVFEDNEEYAQIGGAWIYEGVAGSDGEMVEARDAVRDNNPRVAAVGVREVGVRPMMVNIM